MITNYNITDFNDIEFNPLPHGNPSDGVKHFGFIIFDNGYTVSIAQSIELNGTISYNLSASKNSVSKFGYLRLSENIVTTKLLEISKL